MAIRSMTGYGRGEAASQGVKVTVELKSVNHKQFDCRIDLPPSLSAEETILRERIHKRIARGHVTCHVSLDVSPRVRSRAAAVDEALAGAYLARLRRAAERLGLKEDLSAASLLSLPNVVRFEEPEDAAQSCRPLVLAGLNRALSALMAMREREGKALTRDIAARLKKLQTLMAAVERRAPQVAEQYRRALLERISESGVDLNVDDARLLKEVALYADRADITEELTRLRSHWRQSMAALASNASIGRTLEFLIQEMFREITTVGSKANDKSIAGDVIRFKAELERIREQVQNVE